MKKRKDRQVNEKIFYGMDPESKSNFVAKL